MCYSQQQFSWVQAQTMSDIRRVNEVRNGALNMEYTESTEALMLYPEISPWKIYLIYTIRLTL